MKKEETENWRERIRQENEEFWKKQQEERQKFFTPARTKILDGILNGKPYILFERRLYLMRDEMESIGFVFYDIPDDKDYWLVHLPKEWTIIEEKHSIDKKLLFNLFIIYDKKGRERGSFDYTDLVTNADMKLWLEPRYRIRVDTTHIDENWDREEVYFGNENEKLFVAGSYEIPRTPLDVDTDEEYLELKNKHIAAVKERHRLYGLTQEYALENYPDYKEFSAYWDDEPIKVNKKA